MLRTLSEGEERGGTQTVRFADPTASIPSGAKSPEAA
jgi:hypothetical protein